jgi:hypothetical protein
MPDLGLIKQAKQGMRTFGYTEIALWQVDEVCNQAG